MSTSLSTCIILIFAIVKIDHQRYCIEIAYKGSVYHGWQIQENAASVQEFVDKALSTILRQEVKTLGCGRTDTGVHARQLFAHFDLLQPMVSIDIPRILNGVNSLLPTDIVIKDFFPVAADFHARFDAISRSYEYHIHFGKNPFLHEFSWQLRDKPDVEKMNKAAAIMMEYQDFSCFSKSHTQVFTNNCDIYHAEWNWLTDDRLVFYITANRFLRNMVRAIVGTLIAIGTDPESSIDSIRNIIASKNRSRAGMSVPACGLYLTEVRYKDILQKQNHE